VQKPSPNSHQLRPHFPHHRSQAHAGRPTSVTLAPCPRQPRPRQSYLRQSCPRHLCPYQPPATLRPITSSPARFLSASHTEAISQADGRHSLHCPCQQCPQQPAILIPTMTKQQSSCTPSPCQSWLPLYASHYHAGHVHAGLLYTSHTHARYAQASHASPT
jgi:hypothetical protein